MGDGVDPVATDMRAPEREWHWLERGHLELWLLLRGVARTDGRDAEAATMAALHRLIGAHVEECLALGVRDLDRELRDLIDLSLHDARQQGVRALRRVLTRERRRLATEDDASSCPEIF